MLSSSKRKGRDSDSQADSDPEGTSARSVSPPAPSAIASFIRPASVAWGAANGAPAGSFQSSQPPTSPEQVRRGASPSHKRPRLSSASSSTSEQRSTLAPQSRVDNGEDVRHVPPVHPMFDLSGRAPRPSDGHDMTDEEYYSDEDEGDDEMETDVHDARPRPAPVERPPHHSIPQEANRVSSSPEVASYNGSAGNETRLAGPSNAPDRPKMAISSIMSPRGTSDDDSHGFAGHSPVSAAGSYRSSTRMHTVALIITDTRYGGSDDVQYAEIRVPLEPGPPTGSEFYLAKCRELVGALQASASKIDGEAKIFCERKEADSDRPYKQYLLRISDNEYLPSDGSVKIPKSMELRLTVAELGSSQTARYAYPSVVNGPQPPRINPAQSMQPGQPGPSTPPIRSDGRVAIPPTPQQLRPLPSKSLIPGVDKIQATKFVHPSAHWPKPKGKGPDSQHSGPSGNVSESNDTKSVRARKAMADYVRPLIQKEPFWRYFNETKGHVKSNAEAVKSLRFFEDMVAKYVHTVIPPQVPHVGGKRITKASLLEAVGRGTTWGSDCHIVLGLVERFGPGGPEENPEVVELLGKPPGDKKGGIAEFVSRLKKIRDETDAKRLQENREALL